MNQNEKREYIRAVQDVIEKLRDYWPLTIRQVYYQLVSALLIPNEPNEYKRLIRIMKFARLDGLVPWESIEDRSRTFLESHGEVDKDSFIEWHSRAFLTGYRRDLLQGQAVRLECWIEKDALLTIVHSVADRYRIPVVSGRGFISVSFLNVFRDRVLANHANGQLTRILYMGDFDPSGQAMLPASMKTLQVLMELADLVGAETIALNPEQVEKYDLPHDATAMKDSDTRAVAFIKKHGRLAVELDALRPDILQGIIAESIRRNLDMAEFERQVEIEKRERVELDTYKRKLSLD